MPALHMDFHSYFGFFFAMKASTACRKIRPCCEQQVATGDHLVLIRSRTEKVTNKNTAVVAYLLFRPASDFYRAMHCSAYCGIAIARCLSVRL